MSQSENTVETNSQLAEQQAWIARSLSEPAGDVVTLEYLDIAHVQDVYTLLAERLRADGGLVIDLSAVQSTDGAGLQLLAAVYQAAMKQGRTVELRGVSESLSGAVALLGLSSELGLPVLAQ
jgi:anti-anti-sigma regulatory factor